jgi:hypothetical protein
MKYIGFIKEEDKNIPTAKNLKEMFLSVNNDPIIIKDVVAYLKNGIFLSGVMSFIYDDEKKPIGGLAYFTDGQFVWPVYYPYYLEKYKNFLVDQDLLQHCLSNNFKIAPLSKERLSKIDADFLKVWSKKP